MLTDSYTIRPTIWCRCRLVDRGTFCHLYRALGWVSASRLHQGDRTDEEHRQPSKRCRHDWLLHISVSAGVPHRRTYAWWRPLALPPSTPPRQSEGGAWLFTPVHIVYPTQPSPWWVHVWTWTIHHFTSLEKLSFKKRKNTKTVNYRLLLVFLRFNECCTTSPIGACS